MSEINQVAQYNRTCRVWSDRLEREISLKVQYSVQWKDGCKIIDINDLSEFF